MTSEALDRIADAVLYEGYVLYPYRASAAKNRLRWQFGIVAPRAPNDREGEPSFAVTGCLLEDVDRGRLSVRLRCLRPQLRDDGWLDGRPQAIEIRPIELSGDAVSLDQALDVGGVAARCVVEVTPVDRFLRLQVRIENAEPWHETYADSRDGMLCRSLVSTHLLLAVERAAFVSLLEPPADAAALVAQLENRHAWPVLVGDRARRNVMLSSPIVLYDYPAVARESPGNLCDGTEIDEILSLRILTLTDDEKREARATDPRAQQIIDRVDTLTPGEWQRMHGTMRSADFLNPPDDLAPEEAFVDVQGVRVTRGSRVWLRPSRRADAMDMFLRDQAATVAGVYRDVDARVYVAVTVDADPAASLHESFGRFFYFDPVEVEPRTEER